MKKPADEWIYFDLESLNNLRIPIGSAVLYNKVVQLVGLHISIDCVDN